MPRRKSIMPKLSWSAFQTLDESFTHVRFVEKNHTYSIDGKPAKMSVTKLIHKYETPFDAEKIAFFVARKQGVEVSDVLNKWEFGGEYASHVGSEFHRFVEHFLQRRQIGIDQEAISIFFKKWADYRTPEAIPDYYEKVASLVKNFLEFYKEWKKDHILIRPEFIIGDRETGICGCIDNLSLHVPSQQLIILDWKTNKAMEEKSKYNTKFIGPLSHLAQSEQVKYSLQLWLYRIMLEKNTPFKLKNSQIIWVGNPEGTEIIEVLDLEKEARLILDLEKL